jgi:pimeloyl-ACP methyl ester carboxylesterase
MARPLAMMPTMIMVPLMLLTPQVHAAEVSAASSVAISTRTQTVDGVGLQYLTAGSGPTILLVHGFGETSRMWRPLIPVLASHFRVIAPDLPGIGESEIPKDGPDILQATSRLHGLLRSLGIDKAIVVGHDIGLMVAYAYASQFPSETEKLVLMEAFLPGVGDWRATYDNPAIWHFRFHGPTPEKLVQGHEETYFLHFWDDFAADRTHSMPEADRRAYLELYSRPGRMRAAWSYFASFPQTAIAFENFSKTKLPMPVMSLSGVKANGQALAEQVKLVATNPVLVVLPNTGHWLMEENFPETRDALVKFIEAGRGK